MRFNTWDWVMDTCACQHWFRITLMQEYLSIPPAHLLERLIFITSVSSYVLLFILGKEYIL